MNTTNIISIDNINITINDMNVSVVNWIINNNIKKERIQSIFCKKCGNYVFSEYNKNLLCKC